MAFITVDDIAFQALIESQELDDRYAALTAGLSDGTKDLNVNDITGSVITGGSFTDGVATLDGSGNWSGITTLAMSGDLTINTSAFFVDAGSNLVGIGTATPDTGSGVNLHIFSGSAGTVAANGSSVLTLENNGSTYLQFLSPNTAAAAILFGDPDSVSAGQLFYNHATDVLKITTPSGGALVINEDATDMDFRVEGVGQANALFVQGSDGCVGINNNSPGVALDITGAVTHTGNLTSGGDHVFTQDDPAILGGAGAATTQLYITSGAATNSGANLVLYGASNTGSRENDFQFRSGNTTIFDWDDSDGEFTVTGIFDIVSTSSQFKLSYDANTFITMGCSSIGALSFNGSHDSGFTSYNFNNTQHGENTNIYLNAENAGGTGKTAQLQLDPDTELLNLFDPGKGFNFSGIVGINKVPTPGSALDINFSTEDLEFIDAGSTSASEQDWVQVEVGGNVGYLRVFASK